LNDVDVTASFGVDGSGRLLGLVDGMVIGDNVVEAHVAPPTTKQAAAIVVSNHPIGGPIFSGAQLLPFICARKVATSVTVTVPGTALSGTATTKVSGLDADPVDDQCNAASKITYFYQPKALEGSTCTFTAPNAGSSCFVTYDVNSPPAPADIANFTNDRGDTVKSIIQVTRGTTDRGLYDIVTFFDPTQPSTPQNRQRGWNGKLLWSMGPSSGPRRFEQPPTQSVFNANALSRGFMIASGSLTDHDTNSNDTLAGEFLMMVKEEITETYGEIRYTIGTGCSGGSILQYNIAAAYPGLLDGIQPNCTFPDTLTTAIEVTDCGLLQRYYGVAPGNALTTAKRTAINGHANNNQCLAWASSFLPFGNPTTASNCGSGFPTAITYDPALRPDGVRCTSFDHDASMLGTYVDTDGNRKAKSPLDNVGVQYGLKALAAGTITAEEFTLLNENIGSYTADLVAVRPQRTVANADALETAYAAGLVSDGKQLAKVAIIDLRGQEGSVDIHLNWRAMEVRSRLDKANGNHDNQVIWASGPGITPGAALLLKSFLTMDAWLHAIELDPSNTTIEAKIVANKPAAAHDFCINSSGATDAQVAAELPLNSPSCPVIFRSSPHQVAGGPQSEDIFKCQLKPLDFASADYNGVTFTTDQQTRLAAVFPSGVCDWTLPGVGQVPSDGGSTFKNGPGGEPLGAEPLSDLVPPNCGDGEVIGEDCDDGDTNAGDGCSASCTVEAGWNCGGSPSVCTPICGDGLVRGSEPCDDGNVNGGDGCSAACETEIGFQCSGEPSACDGICGDGLIHGTEACDDGNVASGDGCASSCDVETGYACAGTPSSCAPICGDGLILGGEACDDGNVAASDGCSTTCTVETGFTCTGQPSACDGICGDGLIRGTEACDDAAENGTATSCCSASCQPNAAGTSCDDGNACTTADTCAGGANTCNGGAPPDCDDDNSCTVDSCDTSLGCQHDSAPREGFACDDGNACTSSETCTAGVCTGTAGGDADGDGYCDAQETLAGCNPNDGAEIPPQSTVFGGKPSNGDGNVLVSYVAPTNDKVLKATDPSCAAAGVCGGTGFCTAGKIADKCTTNADCNQPANTCRVVANYAEVADLAVRKPFTVNRTDVSADFAPLTPGCTRKVDITLDPGKRTNMFKVNVTGTVGGHPRRDADNFRYR
jgi:cysteine-rich repeat protein